MIILYTKYKRNKKRNKITKDRGDIYAFASNGEN